MLVRSLPWSNTDAFGITRIAISINPILLQEFIQNKRSGKPIGSP